LPPNDHADLLQEGERIMRICNACRYCEGYCAVFPAMERRQNFLPGDLNYLANLCHNCGECYYACQYAPPHEFAVNVPQLLADLRVQSYAQFTWPGFFAKAFRANGTLALVLTVCLIAPVLTRTLPPAPNFYRVVPHRVMVGLFGTASLLILLAFSIGLARFWRNTGERLSALLNPAALWTACKDVLTLHYLDGGGGGCAYPAARQSQSRRWFHQFTMYGFGLCFASTTSAAFDYYLLAWKAPNPYLSAPVILGTLGGIALIIGTLGLLALKFIRNPATQGTAQTGMDLAFLSLLFLSSATGLALLALRETSRMPKLLVLHLATVLALFLTLPCGKFVHAIYRSAALVKYALETRLARHSPVTSRHSPKNQ